MAKGSPWFWALEAENVALKRSEIVPEQAKMIDMAFARIWQGALRPALSAPIKCDNGETTLQKLFDHLEVFFDELAATLAQHNCSGTGDEAGGPQCRAQLYPIGGGEIAHLSPGRNRVSGAFKKLICKKLICKKLICL